MDLHSVLSMAGAIAGVMGFGLAVFVTGHLVGQERGRLDADDAEFDMGWEDGYSRGWEACRDKAIEYGVADL